MVGREACEVDVAEWLITCERRKDKARPGIKPRVSLIPEGHATATLPGHWLGESSTPKLPCTSTHTSNFTANSP